MSYVVGGVVGGGVVCVFVFFKQKTACEMEPGLEFRRVLFRSAYEGCESTKSRHCYVWSPVGLTRLDQQPDR